MTWTFFVVVVLSSGQIMAHNVSNFKTAQECVDYLKNAQTTQNPPGLENLSGRVIMRGCQALEAVQ
jgi:hypothetical protein